MVFSYKIMFPTRTHYWVVEFTVLWFFSLSIHMHQILLLGGQSWYIFLKKLVHIYNATYVSFPSTSTTNIEVKITKFKKKGIVLILSILVIWLNNSLFDFRCFRIKSDILYDHCPLPLEGHAFHKSRRYFYIHIHHRHVFRCQIQKKYL